MIELKHNSSILIQTCWTRCFFPFCCILCYKSMNVSSDLLDWVGQVQRHLRQPKRQRRQEPIGTDDAKVIESGGVEGS